MSNTVTITTADYLEATKNMRVAASDVGLPTTDVGAGREDINQAAHRVMREATERRFAKDPGSAPGVD